MSGCDKALNAHFYSAASLTYHAPDTWHDTTPSHIILALGRPVLALVSLSAKRGAASTISSTLVFRGPGSNPWPPVPRSEHSTYWVTGAGTYGCDGNIWLQWLQRQHVLIAGVIRGQKTEASALEFMEVTPWWAECRTVKTSCLSEGGLHGPSIGQHHLLCRGHPENESIHARVQAIHDEIPACLILSVVHGTVTCSGSTYHFPCDCF